VDRIIFERVFAGLLVRLTEDVELDGEGVVVVPGAPHRDLEIVVDALLAVQPDSQLDETFCVRFAQDCRVAAELDLEPLPAPVVGSVFVANTIDQGSHFGEFDFLRLWRSMGRGYRCGEAGVGRWVGRQRVIGQDRW